MNPYISIIRLLAIITIVMHHSICALYVFPPHHLGCMNIPDWLFYVNRIIVRFGLGMFTFISGYVLFYQNTKVESFSHFLWKKIKRIVFPCILWGILYLLLFPTQVVHSDWPFFIIWYAFMVLVNDICLYYCNVIRIICKIRLCDVDHNNVFHYFCDYWEVSDI